MEVISVAKHLHESTKCEYKYACITKSLFHGEVHFHSKIFNINMNNFHIALPKCTVFLYAFGHHLLLQIFQLDRKKITPLKSIYLGIFLIMMITFTEEINFTINCFDQILYTHNMLDYLHRLHRLNSQTVLSN